MKNKQNGFSIVELILILVLFGIIGFTGWFVRNARNNANNSLTNASKLNIPKISKAGSSDSNTKTSKCSSGEQSGELEYSNNAVGFSFMYPVKWGVAKNSGNTVTFGEDTCSHMIAWYKSSNVSATGGGDSPLIYAYGYKNDSSGYSILSLGNKTEKIAASDVMYNSEDAQNSYIVFKGTSLGHFYAGMAKLNNKAYDSVIFLSNNETEEPYTQNSTEVLDLLYLLKSFKNT